MPSLRNVTRTAPYFHDGSVAKLDDAIVLMARHQLGIMLSEDDRRAIIAFLGSLEGSIDEITVKEPPRLAGGPATPAPDPN